MSGDCRCDAAPAEGLEETDIGALLGFGFSSRNDIDSDASVTVAPIGDGHRRADRHATQCARSHHALLAERLEISDHLRNQSDKLARHVRDILLAQLTVLVPPTGRSAERRLELRNAAVPTEVLPSFPQAELTHTSSGRP